MNNIKYLYKIVNIKNEFSIEENIKKFGKK